MKKYSEKQKEKFHGIVNDIAEGIDNGESRKTLREALDYYATELSISDQKKVFAESNIKIIKTAWDMISISLK